MLRRRSQPPKRTFCPECDAPLPPELTPAQLAGDVGSAEGPRCPACGIALLPAESAPHWRRFVAALADGAILLITAGLLNWLVLVMLDTPDLLGRAKGLDALLRVFEASVWDLLFRITPFLLMSATYLVLFWAMMGRTPAQRLLGLRVVDAHGERPGFARATIRAFVDLAGLLIGALGWVWALFDLERRAWHDHLAGTYVVKDA